VGGGFTDVTQGPVTITASLGSTKVSTWYAVVQAGALTVISQAPSP
jgi:hypothetical protein